MIRPAEFFVLQKRFSLVSDAFHEDSRQSPVARLLPPPLRALFPNKTSFVTFLCLSLVACEAAGQLPIQRECDKQLLHVLPDGCNDVVIASSSNIQPAAVQNQPIIESKSGSSNISIQMSGGSIRTTAIQAFGVQAYHDGTGAIDIDMSGGSIRTEGNYGRAIYANHTGPGGLDITFRGDAFIQTIGFSSFGLTADRSGAGGLDITVLGGEISTAGRLASGIYADHSGSGASDVAIFGGTIKTTGVDARGVYARHTGTGSLNIMMSGGIIETSGSDSSGALKRDPHGIWGDRKTGSGALDIAMFGGSITTKGLRANGIYGTHISSGDMNIALSGGDITTETGDAHGIYGEREGTGTGDTDIIMSSGSITTKGIRSRGISGKHYSSGNLKIKFSGGDIKTERTSAYGIYGDSNGTGNLDITMSGGMIQTWGDSAHGIWGNHAGLGDLNIEMSGGDLRAGGHNAYSIYGRHTGTGDMNITLLDSDIQVVKNSGRAIYGQHTGFGDLNIALSDADIRTSANAGYGIFGNRSGTDDMTIALSDSRIQTENRDAHAIYGRHAGRGNFDIALSDVNLRTAGSSAYAIFGRHVRSGNLGIALSGSSVRTAGSDSHAIHANRSGSGGLDFFISGTYVGVSGDRAAAIRARHRGAGYIALAVDHAHLVAAGADSRAIEIASDSRVPVTVALESAVVQASSGDAIQLGSLNDLLEVTANRRSFCAAVVGRCRSATRIIGNVDFASGYDTLTFDASMGSDLDFTLDGQLWGLERLRKIGRGALRLGDLDASDAASFMTLEDGDLHLTGHLNLGLRGLLTIYDASRLIFGYGSKGEYGRITAHSVSFRGSEKLYLADGAGWVLHGKDVLLDGKFRGDRNKLAWPVLYNEAGQEVGRVDAEGVLVLASPPEGPSPIVGPPSSPEPPLGKEPSKRPMLGMPQQPTARLGFGTQPVLGRSERQREIPSQPLAGIPSAPTMKLVQATLDGGLVRSAAFRAGRLHLTEFANPVGATVRGFSVGMSGELGDGFRVNTSFTPIAEIWSNSANRAMALAGEVWTSTLSWSNGELFSDIALAHGQVDGEVLSDALGGHFLGNLAVSQTHVEARAGRILPLETVSVIPSISLFAGTQHHIGHTTSSGTLEAAVPSFTQGYRGMGGRIDVVGDWREEQVSFHWRPELRLSVLQTVTGGPKVVRVRKSDRAGVLSFVSEERVGKLPGTEYRLGLGAEFRGASNAWRARFGYAGEWADGEVSHAAEAVFILKF